MMLSKLLHHHFIAAPPDHYVGIGAQKQNPMQLGKWVGIETTAVMPMPAHAQPRHITYTDHPPNISGQHSSWARVDML